MSNLSAQVLAEFTNRALRVTGRAMQGLTQEEVQFRIAPRENCIGFEAWHILRTCDNLVHFAFEREQPIWTQQNLHEEWGLPRVDQGTNTPFEEVATWVFPRGDLLAAYASDIAEVIVPRIADMDEDYLRSITRIVPHGELPKWEIIGHLLVSHSNRHLGHISAARTLIGKEGLGF